MSNKNDEPTTSTIADFGNAPRPRARSGAEFYTMGCEEMLVSSQCVASQRDASTCIRGDARVMRGRMAARRLC